VDWKKRGPFTSGFTSTMLRKVAMELNTTIDGLYVDYANYCVGEDSRELDMCLSTFNHVRPISQMPNLVLVMVFGSIGMYRQHISTDAEVLDLPSIGFLFRKRKSALPKMLRTIREVSLRQGSSTNQ
jgi:hypothetical protein